LLDEPLASLDYVLQKRLQRELADLNVELDMTFIYVTHSLESALVMSDRLFVLEDGDVLQTGTPETIYRQPKNKFIAEFMGDANVFPISVEGREGETIEVSSPSFQGSAAVPYSSKVEVDPDHLVVRHDDCVVDPEPTQAMAMPARVVNILNQGNTALVEVEDDTTGEEYVSEMSLDRVTELGLQHGDDVYLQWEADKAIPVPE
jgi:ABC-type Fe3+/spermidine/putrescine transport system ATPase subunit